MSKTFNLFIAELLLKKLDKICYFTVTKASSIGLNRKDVILVDYQDKLTAIKHTKIFSTPLIFIKSS